MSEHDDGLSMDVKDRLRYIRTGATLEERIARAREMQEFGSTESVAIGYFITALRGSNVSSHQYTLAAMMLKLLRAFTTLPGKMFGGNVNWMADSLEGLSLYLRHCGGGLDRPAHLEDYSPRGEAQKGIKRSVDAAAVLLEDSLERIEFKYPTEV